MSTALLNLVVLWDGIKENERTGDLLLNISGRKLDFLLCAICEMSVIAVALSHIFPVANSVARLRQRWIVLYVENKAMVIKRIQDTGNCCGLASLTDKAWPFENSQACHEIYKREVSCLSSWLESHNFTAILIIIVVSSTLIFKWIFIAMSICFKDIKGSPRTYDSISTVDKDLESGLYDLKTISQVEAYSTSRVNTTTREANKFQNCNILRDQPFLSFCLEKIKIGW